MSDVPIVIVGGSAYADIDVLACAVAYKEYLNLLGFRAHAIITGPWNQTIPPSVKKWNIEVEKEFPYKKQACRFVLVDISDPHHLNDFVDIHAVIEVFDHHHGYEAYWKDKIGSKSGIEKVGACATLIWEKIKEAKLEGKISTVSMNLLYTAILANTLDFKSAVTQERDRIAAREIEPYTQLPPHWKEIYYHEIEEEFMENAYKNLLEDTKKITLLDRLLHFGQIELKDAKAFLKKHLKELTSLTGPWIINVVSIEEGCSYLFSNFAPFSDLLKKITEADVKVLKGGSNLLTTSRLWLRKELLKELISSSSHTGR